MVNFMLCVFYDIYIIQIDDRQINIKAKQILKIFFKSREFTTSRSVLQAMLKELLGVEEKGFWMKAQSSRKK